MRDLAAALAGADLGEEDDLGAEIAELERLLAETETYDRKRD